jgi:integrase
MIKKPSETSLTPKQRSIRTAEHALQAVRVVARRRPRRRDRHGAITITIPPEALNGLLQVFAGGTVRRSQAPYDLHSPDTPADEGEADVLIDEAQSPAHQQGLAPPKARAPSARAQSAETVRQYFARWQADRRKHGIRDVDTENSRFTHHIEPLLGSLRIQEVTSDNLEDLVTQLEKKIAAHAIKFKTANNVWAIASKMFGDAKSSRRRELRVRADNPAANVRGPDPSLHVKRRKSYLYPSEFLQLLSSEKVPVRWARIYALAIYTYGRAGEQAALTCEDVDLQARKIELVKQLDAKTGELRETKESAKFAIPIEPNLLPLLEHLMREAGGKGPLLQADRAAGQVHGLPRNDASAKLRRHLQMAGVTRSVLFADDELRKPLTFHDLRGTAATWMALRGDPPLTIQQRIGHRQFSTTQLYIREAEAVGQGAEIGEPFPPLPERLLRRPT